MKLYLILSGIRSYMINVKTFGDNDNMKDYNILYICTIDINSEIKLNSQSNYNTICLEVEKITNTNVKSETLKGQITNYSNLGLENYKFYLMKNDPINEESFLLIKSSKILQPEILDNYKVKLTWSNKVYVIDVRVLFTLELSIPSKPFLDTQNLLVQSNLKDYNTHVVSLYNDNYKKTQ